MSTHKPFTCESHVWEVMNDTCQLMFEDKTVTAFQWLKLGLESLTRGEPDSSVQAFRAASRLFRDAGKQRQQHTALKLALRLSPRDHELADELRTVTPAASHDSFRRLSRADWVSLFGTDSDAVSAFEDFVAHTPTVVDSVHGGSRRS